VFDILFNNTTDIQPEIHSTDTHGTNEVNFALLHLFGYQFAPRYKDLYDKVRTSLVGFKHPSQYGDAIIKPVRKAQKEFIVSEWDNIQRIIVSLALKATTQSTIVSKLSAYAKAGVKECWLVLGPERQIEIFVAPKKNGFSSQSLHGPGGRVRSTAGSEFKLGLDALFSEVESRIEPEQTPVLLS